MKEKEIVHAIEEYDVLIYKVLGKCRVHPTNNDYEDLFQELRIKVLVRLQEFSTIEEFQRAVPAGYLFRKLSWHCRNMLNKRWLEEKREAHFPDEMEGLEKKLELVMESFEEELLTGCLW